MLTGPTLKKWISEGKQCKRLLVRELRLGTLLKLETCSLKPQLDFGLSSPPLRKSLPTTLLSPDVGYRPHPDTEGTDSKRKTERER